MKGQRLFIRPFDESDNDLIRDFLAGERSGSDVPACGLLAKLVGDLVAIVATDLEQEQTVSITDIFVADRLRRKRIGRALVEEAVVLARKLGARSVTAPAGRCDAFFERNGFELCDGVLVRRV